MLLCLLVDPPTTDRVQKSRDLPDIFLGEAGLAFWNSRNLSFRLFMNPKAFFLCPLASVPAPLIRRISPLLPAVATFFLFIIPAATARLRVSPRPV